MKISRRQLRKIIREEYRRSLSENKNHSEQLINEGLMDFIGGLFGGLINFFKQLGASVIDAASSTKGALQKNTTAAVSSVAKKAGRDDVKSLDDLDLTKEEDQKLYFTAQASSATSAAKEALNLLKEAESVKSWIPDSDSEEDLKKWEDENGDDTVVIWRAWGTALGLLQFLGERGIDSAATAYKKGSAITGASPAEAIAGLVDSVTVLVDVWQSAEAFEGVSGVSSAWEEVISEAKSIANKISSAAKEEQQEKVQEWIHLRKWVGANIILERSRGKIK